METNHQDDYLYIVKVYEESEVFKYEYGNHRHAKEHYDMEKSKGNLVELFRRNTITGQTARFQERLKCNCAKCQPKKIIRPKGGM